jgi:putative phosphoribosyl transferase
VGAAQACRELEEEVDELICPLRPDPFFAVGVWYDDFEQLTDTEVKALLK